LAAIAVANAVVTLVVVVIANVAESHSFTKPTAFYDSIAAAAKSAAAVNASAAGTVVLDVAPNVVGNPDAPVAVIEAFACRQCCDSILRTKNNQGQSGGLLRLTVLLNAV
jgi:hypothetical protein